MKLRLSTLLPLALLMGCSQAGTLVPGGVMTLRSACPLVGIPAGTGDITLFNPPGSSNAAAIDVSATMTNLRATCTDVGDEVVSTATFDVVGVRRDAGPARQVVLPYFDVALRGGDKVIAKQVGRVALDFPAGAIRASTRGQATIRVHRSAVALPPEVERRLERERRPGDPDAAIDPLSDPTVREAVANATFEHLVGFQLTEAQLRYNVTR